MHSILQECTSGDFSSIAGAAKQENISEERLARNILAGRCIVLKNASRPYAPCAIGEGAGVKVNVNIGTSGITCSPENEIEKAKAAVENGADALMDLSTGGDLPAMRREILKLSIKDCFLIFVSDKKATQSSYPRAYIHISIIQHNCIFLSLKHK